MKKLILFLTVLLTASPSWATWTFKQAKCTGTTTTDGCSGPTCTLSGLSAVTAGSSLVSVLMDDNGNHTISSITTETWTHCANCSHADGANSQIDADYAVSAAGGQTSIDMTISGSSTGWNWCLYEAKSSLTPAFDNAAGATISGAAPTSSNVTITGTNDFLVAGFGWSGSLTGVTSPYANFVESNGDGTASNINSANGNGAAFTPTTSGHGPEFTLAFSESGGGGGGGGVVGGKATVGGKVTIGK